MTVTESIKAAHDIATDNRAGWTAADILTLARELREEAELREPRARAVLRPEGMPGEAVPTGTMWALPAGALSLGTDYRWYWARPDGSFGDKPTLPEALAALGVK